MKVQQGTLAAIVLAMVTMAGSAATAQADSIAYVKENNVWIAKPDGSGQRQVTRDGTSDAPYRSVTQDDNGVLLASRGKQIVRLRQSGAVINTLPIATPNGNGDDAYNTDGPTPGSEGSPPNALDVTPDGTKVAYWFLASCYRDIGTIHGYVPCPKIGVSWTDRFTKPAELSGPNFGQGWFPQWLGSSDRFAKTGESSTEVYVDQAPPPDCSPSPSCYVSFWLRNCYAQNGTDVCEGARDLAVSRDGTKLAVVSTNEDAVGFKLVLYTSAGAPEPGRSSSNPSEPTPQCLLESPTGGEFANPEYAPDGSGLAWQEGDGIHVVRGDQCGGSSAAATIPGGSDPAWGPADVTAAAGGGGGGSARPAVSAVSLSSATLPRGGKVKLRLRLSVPATVRIVVQRGSRIMGSLTRKGKAGANSFAFDGRVGGKRLAVGRYRLVITARTATGRVSAAVKRNLKVS